MSTLIELLKKSKKLDGFKINTNLIETSELFFVHKKLETVRHTKTSNVKATVYVNHDDFFGQADFTVYASNTEDEIKAKIEMGYQNALLVNNKPFSLPSGEVKEFKSDSNFNNYSLNELASLISEAVFKADNYLDGGINALEIFVTKKTVIVENSTGLKKTQVLYDTMIEAIPTWNGNDESVELYEQYHVGYLNPEEITKEIKNKMEEVHARFEAKKPDSKLKGNIILRPHEISEILDTIITNANYGYIYTHQNLYNVGDKIQNSDSCDKLNIKILGNLKGSVSSSFFDIDGIDLESQDIIKDGVIVNGYGSNKVCQYMNKPVTGMLPCTELLEGSFRKKELYKEPYLECVSLSGIQLDQYNDYIGGEIRLGYYFDGNKKYPVTGISFSGKLSDALNTIRLSKEKTLSGSYYGPEIASISKMEIL